jgi:hypothetical protein
VPCAEQTTRLLYVVSLIGCYSLCSSMLLILNKVRPRTRSVPPSSGCWSFPHPLLAAVLAPGLTGKSSACTRCRQQNACTKDGPAAKFSRTQQACAATSKRGGCDSRPPPSPCVAGCGEPTKRPRLHPSPRGSAAQVAVTLVPAPSFILFAQLATSAAFVQALAAAGQVECERLAPGKARRFALIVLGFIGALYSNVTALRARARAHPAERGRQRPRSARGAQTWAI